MSEADFDQVEPQAGAALVDVSALASELLSGQDADPHAGRVIVGLCGAPGAGKTTLSLLLVAELNRRQPGVAVAVPMDGFHLAQEVIALDERATRRGAPDTFDPGGYASLLARLRAADEDVIYAPRFERDLEDPVAGAIPVPVGVRVVITEGNYLLLPAPEWRRARAHLDAVWYLQAPDEQVRVEHLIARHERFGKSADHARRHVLNSDEANARLVAAHARAADRQLRWDFWS